MPKAKPAFSRSAVASCGTEPQHGRNVVPPWAQCCEIKEGGHSCPPIAFPAGIRLTEEIGSQLRPCERTARQECRASFVVLLRDQGGWTLPSCARPAGSLRLAIFTLLRGRKKSRSTARHSGFIFGGKFLPPVRINARSRIRRARRGRGRFPLSLHRDGGRS